MRNKNKKYQKKIKDTNLSNRSNNEEDLRDSLYYDEYDFRDVETREYSIESEEAFERLKIYIKDLYKKQEDAKKLQ